MTQIKLAVMDLDGSLLNSSNHISTQDQNMLAEFGNAGIIRVVATGRNWYSTRKVLNNNPHIDYAIISTGLGIINYENQEFLNTNHLTTKQVRFIAEFLLKENVDFMIHDVLPDNHYVICYDAGNNHPDYLLRWGWYRNFASNFIDLPNLKPASQFLSFHPHRSPRIDEIKAELIDFHVVRTTSPITRHYDWMEIFPPSVSKGHALRWLCNSLNIDIKDTLCLGNDYNDLDMLNIAGHSFVTANAPEDIKSLYNCTVSNDHSPLSTICRISLPDILL
jgi:Cof subfamily protein (haloacid dehalogenase superfamily)